MENNKQETVEEASKRLAKEHCDIRVNTNTTEFQVQQLIIKGIKWQQGRSYSEEDIVIAFDEGQAYSVTGKLVSGNEWVKSHKKEWFKQFKKK